MEMRVCSKCDAEKPATREFFGFSNDVLRAHCKECAHKYAKEYRRKNPEKIKEKNKISYNKIRELRIKNKKYKTPVELNLIIRIRGIVSKFINKYFKLRKPAKSTKGYGIDYEKIIEHLAPYPEDIENYYIAHNKNLKTVNFNNIEQVKLIFAPENFKLLKIPPKITKKEKQKRKRERYKMDPQFNLKERLRARVRKAFRLYSETGKIAKSQDYGIDYDAIIEHLGDCPGDLEKYHIDHIKPLILFDLNNLEQIKLAFAPENHQWLKAEDNLKKSSTYKEENKEEVND